ncbi:MAG: M23 family metallopeptidase [bacterium]|nr:M23 family metallopeptidase [bacterium]
MKRLVLLLMLFSTAEAVAQDLSLPFKGRWFVMQGGDTLNVNHHMAVPAQAYGIDFAKVGGPSGRELTRRTPTRVEDFFCWDEAVLAPAEGVVATVVGDLPDNPLGSKDPLRPAGNHIIIETKEGLFVFLAHLKRNSVSVVVGDRVRRMQPLGLCGNSGNSDYPHVHLHLQDTATFNHGTGQNPTFGPIDVELTGKLFKAVTWPLIRGLIVSNTEKTAGSQSRIPSPRAAPNIKTSPTESWAMLNSVAFWHRDPTARR